MESDAILKLAKLGLEGNKESLVEYIKTLAAISSNKKRTGLYRQLLALVQTYEVSDPKIHHYQVSSIDNSPLPVKRTNHDSLWFSPRLKRHLDRIVQILEDETMPPYLINRFGKILLYGPPGGGKTTAGFYIAERLNRPIRYVKVSDVISHRFGETLKNLSVLFEESGNDIIFIDEFDAFAKSRYDSNDVGELKRIVNSLIQTIDVLSEDKILIVATNLVESIDPAILRRFPTKVHMGALGKGDRAAFIKFLIAQPEYRNFKLNSVDVDFLDKLLVHLDIKSVDGIKNLFDSCRLTAHLEKKKIIKIEDFVETMMTLGALTRPVLKNLGETNPQLYKGMMKVLTDTHTKLEVAEMIGLHRNSLNNYGKEV